MMNEVKGIASQDLQALEKIPNKKTLKFHLELNFKKFRKGKMEKFEVGCYNILIVGIDIIGFCFNIKFSELVFSIILYFFLLHILWKVNTKVSSLVIFFINS